MNVAMSVHSMGLRSHAGGILQQEYIGLFLRLMVRKTSRRYMSSHNGAVCTWWGYP